VDIQLWNPIGLYMYAFWLSSHRKSLGKDLEATNKIN